MALTSTMYRFRLEVSDVDRGVYESLDLRAAMHPSETVPYLLARVLAHALEQREGLGFTRGLAASEEPALWAKDLTGRLLLWVEVGQPTVERLHRAAKAAEEVALYLHRDPGPTLRALSGQGIHRAEAVRVVALPEALLGELARRLDRQNTWSVLRNEGSVYVTGEGGTGPAWSAEGALVTHALVR